MASPGEDPFDLGGTDDFLSEVMAGNVLAVRKYFNAAFWMGWRNVQVEWKYLKLALLREDKPMLKLLVTWGASATEDDLVKFRAATKDKYPHYIKLLRQAGLPVSAAMENLPYVEPAAPVLNAGLIPHEWKKVLETVQSMGAAEAVIAGGALRDLFNSRAVKDVDIFLKTRGNEKKNREFLLDVFNATRLRFQENSEAPDYYLAEEDLPDPDNSRLSIKHNGKLGPIITGECDAESWTVKVKSRKTEYNIVFVDNVKSINKDNGHYVPVDFDKTLLINCFDLGLCQIAYDGREISTTSAYDHDVKHRQITLLNPNDKSREHLQRIFKKYSDWELCEKSRKLLSKKPPSADAWMMYTWSGWR